MHTIKYTWQILANTWQILANTGKYWQIQRLNRTRRATFFKMNPLSNTQSGEHPTIFILARRQTHGVHVTILTTSDA
jgi:hypothetical protein